MKNKCNCESPSCDCNKKTFCPDIILATGSVHNKILDNIAKDSDFPNLSNEKVNQIAKSTTDSEFRKLGVNGFSFLSFEDVDKAAKDIEKNLDKVLITLADEGKINPTEAKYLKQILEMVQATKNPADLNMKIIALQNEVFSSIELSNEEKTLIGVASSIANASNAYWRQQLIDGPWKKVINPEFDENDLFRINWADAIGGALGCIGCAIAGGGISGCVGCGSQLGGYASKLFAKK